MPDFDWSKAQPVVKPKPVAIAQPPVPVPVQRQTVPLDLHMAKPAERTGIAVEMGGIPGNETPTTTAVPPGAADAPVQADVPVTHPDGRTGTIPAANLSAALKLGYKQGN